MNKQYQLIHIDTNEVTMCEKFTDEGFDYYMKKSYDLCDNAEEHVYNMMINAVATNNPHSGCPQVVDYVDKLADTYLINVNKKVHKDYERDHWLKTGFINGNKKHSETHSLSDEEVVLFVSNVDFKGGILNPKELLEIFKSTLPTKVYYR